MNESKQGAQAPHNSNRNRKLALLSLAVVFIGSGVLFAGWWLTAGQYREITDNAYVTGGMYYVEPQVAGTVVWIGAENTEYVKKGQPLIRLGDADLVIAMERAKAQLSESVLTVANLRARVERLKAALTAGKIDLAMARDEMERRKGLVEIKAVSREVYDKARAAYESAVVSLEVARLNMEAASILAGGEDVGSHPRIMTAKSALREAFLNTRRVVMVAPADGYVAKRSVQVGQLVAPGRPLMSVIPLDDVYVEANFKETQLRHMRLGQPVTLKSDLYSSAVEFTGKVAGFGAGTGGVFAILPPQNATGNWIKIVQRAPVRIELDQQNNLKEAPLILGLSMMVTVDTSDRGGKRLTGGEPGKRKRTSTDVYADQAEGVEEMVESVYMASLEAARPAPPEE
ncbi:MAG: efflux RND transporter periplasmic adaptor subunit [Nitrospinota bacterium]|nr:efflux RND transporter periplasmic adaptor subunit [Nitrospinota bacterium]